ncbi:MAG: hypothetical protein H6613_00980 [Ignavibacteriales bacterium]|nr:hypothetical protein [Ignavibacteriales bacterium]
MSVPNSLENPFTVFEVLPESEKPGEIIGSKFGETVTVTHKQGTANASVDVNIVAPKDLTGDNYEVFFDQQHYYLDKDGKWKKTNFPDSIGNSLNKPADQLPSKLVAQPTIYAPGNTLDLHFVYDNQAPDYNYADGLSITFPDGIQINSAADAIGNAYGTTIHPVIEGQTVTWGSNDTTADGEFAGGEDFSVNINAVDPTFSVSFVIFDDGWSEAYAATDPQYYNLGSGTVNGVGTTTLDGTVGYQFKTEQHWNVRNTTTDKVVIEDQKVLSGVDYFTGEDVGLEAGPIAEGLQFNIDGSYGAPSTIASATASVTLNGTKLPFNGVRWVGDDYIFTDFTYFGYPDGTVAASLGPAGYVDGAGGTTDVDLLQQDYEIRWTGVLGNEVINGLNLEVHLVVLLLL